MNRGRLHESIGSPMVSVRLVTADSYQAKPLPQLDPSFSEFRGSEIKHVPVIRVFGATSNGEKTCLHVHGVFPYLFVPYTGEEDPQILAYRLAASLDAAINVSLGSATSNSQHVYSIQRVSGTPFYGYHRKEHQFFKIYFYNPVMIKRAADLLQNGSVLNQSLQPHEAHINYILQFMMDYNIYGMSFVNLRSVKHRRVTQTLGALTSSGQSVSSESSEIIYLPVEIERQSTCELEIDAHASDILNRLEIDQNLKLNPGLAAIWDEERARRAQAGFEGGDSQLVNPKSPTRPPFHPTDNDIYQNQRLARRLQMISQADESTLSTTSNRSVAYAAEVREGEDLLNASRVPNVSVERVERIYRDQVEDSLEISNFMDGSIMPASQILTQENSILGVDDMPLVDLLAQLARENDESSVNVDVDSLLGSQVSVLLDESDKNEKEDDEEGEDVPDLNLTSLELDSLGSLEVASEKQELERITGTEKSGSNPLIISPFLSPWESPSCSPKSVNNVEENEDSRYRMPQYDGAGDVSPSLLRSDDEETEENGNNAKELDRFSEFNCTTEATEPRKASRFDSRTNLTSEITNDVAGFKSAELLQDSAPEHRVSREETCSEIADICVGHYCVVGYEPFDRMLEMGNDLIPDFTDMQSSMEIGIESAESMGETIEEQVIVLETVLNGDPCFTESAEFDKSDVTELHDQYVSLMGNALLPDLPVIDNDLNEVSSSTEREFGCIDKAREVTSQSCYDSAAINSLDSSSSSENVAPNIQELGSRVFLNSKLNNAINDCEPSDCKERMRLGSDTADYNCNVVATWAELQNFRTIDKSENRRRRKKKRKFFSGPRSMKRRGVNLFRPKDVPSQVFGENTEKIPLIVSNENPSSLEESSQHSSSKNAGHLVSFASEEENNTEKQTSDIIRNSSEQLPCSSQNFSEIAQSLNKDSDEDFCIGTMTDNVDLDNQQISSPDKLSAEIINTLSEVKYPTYHLTDSFVVRSFSNFEGTSENHIQDLDVALNIDAIDDDPPISHGTSYYSSKRLENRHHRHCTVTKSNKILQNHVFTSDELWIIHKNIRRRLTRSRANFFPTKAVCTNRHCKLPVVLLRKIGHRQTEKIVNAEENDKIFVTGENAEIVAEEVIVENLSEENSAEKQEIVENPASLKEIVPKEKNVESPKQRSKRTRRKRNFFQEIISNEVSKKPVSTESSISVTDTKIENSVHGDSFSNDILHTGNCHRPNRLERGTYNTRRRSMVQKLARKHRRNSEKTIENEDDEEKERKVKAKTKEPKLPGIPGIPNEVPKKRRRSRNEMLVNTGNGRANEELPKKKQPKEVYCKREAAPKTPKNLVTVTLKKAPRNGLVLTTQNLEVSPEKSPERSLETKSPISPRPKKNTRRQRNRRNSSAKCLDFSSTTEKLEEPEGKNEPYVVRDQKKLPESVVLSLMLKEAKSRSTRTQLELLRRKRIYEQSNGNKVETKLAIKRYPRKEDKIVCDKPMEESTLETSVNYESLDQSNKESEPILEENIDDSVISDAPSFETVTDVSAEEMSQKNDVSIASLKNVRDFEDTTLVIGYSDPSGDIFDNEASSDSINVEIPDVTEFSNGAEESSYDTDRYENAIKEANFFAGKDYSIDAVSNEIPTCLFEEDSNPIDKHLSKRTNHDFVVNAIDSSGNLDVESISELSVDPRDLDVYDVQSLTSSSSISALDGTNDVSESMEQIFHDYNAEIVDNVTNYFDDDETSVAERIPKAHSEDTISEDNLTFEGESPAFEPLSPEPQFNLSIDSNLQNEFTAQSEIGESENQNIPEDFAKNSENKNLRTTNENSPQRVSSILPKDSIAETQISLNRISSEPAESSPKGVASVQSKIEDSENQTISEDFAKNTDNENLWTTNKNSSQQVSTVIPETSPRAFDTSEEISTNTEKNQNLSSNTSKDESKSTLVDVHENISENIETELENSISDENKKELSSDLDEKNGLNNKAVEIAPTKIITEKEKISENSENETKSEILPETGENVADIPENVSELSTSCNKEKNLSERLQLEIPPSGILFMGKFSGSTRKNPEVTTIFEKKIAKKNGAFSPESEKKGQISTTMINDDKIADLASVETPAINDNTEPCKQIEKKNIFEGNAEKNQTSATNGQYKAKMSTNERRNFDKKCKSAEEQVEKSIIEIEATTSLPKELPEERIDAKIKKIEENSADLVVNVISRNNGTQENAKSNSIDINKNNVVSVPETENRRSKIQHKPMERRPISIELKYINLSKIKGLAPKWLHKPEVGNIEELFKDNENEELAMESESVEYHETYTTDMTVEKPIDPVNSCTRNTEISTDSELSDVMDKRVRKRRRKSAKDKIMPERRSERIGAEMTLKMSEKEDLSKITTEAATTKEEIPNTPTVAGSHEKKEENLKEITDELTKPDAKSSVQESKMKISQELVLAEQSIMDENSAPIITVRKESRKKMQQTKAQEISLPKIADENTAPIFDNAARKPLQINVHETGDDLKSSKQIEKNIVENMSTEIEVHSVDFKLKISEPQADSENLIPSEQFRVVAGRRSKISKTTKVHCPAKSTPKRNSREKMRTATDSKSPINNMDQDLTSSMILSPPICSLNNALKKIFDVEKSEESLIEESEISEESVQRVQKTLTQDNEMKQQIGKNINVITRIPLLPKHDLSVEKMIEDKTELNDSPARKRGRPRKVRHRRKETMLKTVRSITNRRGWRKKVSSKSEQAVKKEDPTNETPLKPEQSVRKRGRPRKYPIEIVQKPSENENSTEALHTKLHKISTAQWTINQNSHDIVDTTLIAKRPENSNKVHTEINALESLAMKPQLKESGRSSKRVHFEAESIRIFSEDLPSEEQSLDVHARKHYKKSQIDISQNSQELDIADAVDEQSLIERLQCYKKIVHKIEKTFEPANSEVTRKNSQTSKNVKKIKKQGYDLRAFKSRWQSGSLPNSNSETQQQMPIIRLKRLSQNFLERYGIVYRWEAKKFVKIGLKALKKNNEEVKEEEEEFQVPAYDGAADLSSSEEEDQNVTIAREEKRVCTYSSSKKSVSKGETVLKTPLKRKLEMESGALSPKRQALGPKLRNESKTGSLNSPNRTSTSKTPGRNVANYSPLKIIVTSPKVRKDISEPRASSQSSKLDDEAQTSSFGDTATTPSRKNSRLHDNLLRGRINSVKSSLRESGDDRASMGKVGSKAVGELDEIRFTGEKKDEISHASSRIRDSGMMLKDGKDVRKKLLFLDQASSDGIDELSEKKVQGEGTELGIILNDNERSEEKIDNAESVDVSKSLKGSLTMDPVAGPSRCNDDPGGLEVCGIETEVNSDEDENDEDICNVTFTQFIETQRNQEDETFLSNLDAVTQESNNRITIIPKFKPPSRDRVVETMEEYGIPKFRNQEPFFSESVDVPKQKELAHKILKVPGRGVEFLPQFVSSLEEVTGLGRWRKMWLNEFHPSLARTKEPTVKMALASDEKVIITPIALPPTQKQVKDWMRARDYLNRKKTVNVEQKIEAKEQTVIEIQDKRVHDGNFASSPHSSDSSIIEPSPERTIVSEDLKKTGNTTLKSKLARTGLLKSCVIDGETNLQESNDSKEKSFKNSINTEPDPSLLDVLKKSQLFRDQEASRHLGISCGQIEFLSDSTRGNITNENLQKAKALIKYQYLTIMCLEIHVVTRGDLLPDAQHDPIAAIFYSVQSDVPPESSIKPLEHGVIVVADTEKATRKMYYSYASKIPWKISFVNNEEALLNALVTLITRTDPEILMGWEIETLSWGYVFQRASSLGMNLLKRVSRIPATQYKWEYEAPDIEKLTEVKLPGRIVLDIWRIMRHEAALLSYTFENVIHHVLNERIPCPSFKILTDWWNLEKLRPSRWRVVEHYSIRVLGVLRILDQLDIIGRTSELARLFGIQFFEVFSRGSQFRVESVMLRLAKPLNYIAVSPSSQQRASMRAMEALPLILEPESMLYSDPLIVLDFQSLYPSIIIAHNLCFSTCLGRIEHIGQPQPFEFGAYTLRVPKTTAMKLQGKVNYAPCGVAYVKPEVRLGILPRMLTEILETRFMVKKAMKDHDKNDKTLQRALHSRQMGLKFLANVTYGYTAANFSGRMPCIEVGDSVISKSKETLERAIKLVEATPKWGARVVYGDTDSLFILVPGKSKDEAFVIGNEIADAVTASNLPPIKLKFEKILYPAILQTKKRYCGYMYETPDQETPTYLAKGIETVRRDGCPAVSKILEKTLKILFETKDVSLVKKYVTRQLDKVLRGKVSIQDLTFAKEFRGLKGYKAKACVPTLELTRRLMRKDPRAVPRTSERVRYVIVAGAPNEALIHCVRTPWELIRDPGLRPNAIYYVTRVIIPPLNRCLNLMGVDVNEWYKEMPHRHILDNPVGQPSDKQKLTIFQYFGTIVCVACGQPSNKGICTKCLKRPADTLVVIYEKLRWLDRTNNHVTSICQSCVGQGDVADCGSLDCPMLYRRAQAERELSQAMQLREIIKCGNNLEF